MSTIQKPWVTGPKELLNHGLQHLELDTDFDSRMAMISIDNAVCRYQMTESFCGKLR